MSDIEVGLNLPDMRRRLLHTTTESVHSVNLETKPSFGMQLASHTTR
jgi:hypothetical protein